MITVYSMNGCAQCVSAAKLLESKGIPLEVVKIDEDVEAARFIKASGARTMPQCYQDGVLIPGGFVGLQKFVNN